MTVLLSYSLSSLENWEPNFLSATVIDLISLTAMISNSVDTLWLFILTYIFIGSNFAIHEVMNYKIQAITLLYGQFKYSTRAGYPNHLTRVLGRELHKSHLIPEIRSLKRCKTKNLRRVSRQTLGPDLRHDSHSPSYIVWVTGFQV